MSYRANLFLLFPAEEINFLTQLLGERPQLLALIDDLLIGTTSKGEHLILQSQESLESRRQFASPHGQGHLWLQVSLISKGKQQMMNE